MNIFQQKQELRKQVRHLKNHVSLEEKKKLSIKIFEKLEESALFLSSQTIMAYWSMDDEVYTHDFVLKWASQKRIILPVVDGANIVLKEFKGVEHLVAGERFGIPEPAGPIFKYPELIDLIIVPGVAFDKDNNRMGRGKAYYDKLLRESKAHKIGICFPFQLFPSVPHDHMDVKMDEVIF